MLRIGFRLPSEVLFELLDYVLVLGDECRGQRLRRRVRLVLIHYLVDVVGVLANCQLVLVVHGFGRLKFLLILNVLFRFHFSLHQHSKLDFVTFIDSTDTLDEGHRCIATHLLKATILLPRVDRDMDRIGGGVLRR